MEGTTPWTGEVEQRLESKPRAMQDAYMEVGGTSSWTSEGRTMQEQLSRVVSGTKTEQSLVNEYFEFLFNAASTASGVYSGELLEGLLSDL